MNDQPSRDTIGWKRTRTHKDLRVWQEEMDAAMTIFELSKQFPREEKYSLVDQIRRSSRSVAANLAEAWRKRRYQGAFVAKLNDCEGEASETQTWIEFGRRCGYLNPRQAHDLDKKYETLLSQIVKMIANPGVWVLKRPGN